jgi:hypothetical protein
LKFTGTGSLPANSQGIIEIVQLGNVSTFPTTANAVQRYHRRTAFGANIKMSTPAPTTDAGTAPYLVPQANGVSINNTNYSITVDDIYGISIVNTSIPTALLYRHNTNTATTPAMTLGFASITAPSTLPNLDNYVGSLNFIAPVSLAYNTTYYLALMTGSGFFTDVWGYQDPGLYRPAGIGYNGAGTASGPGTGLRRSRGVIVTEPVPATPVSLTIAYTNANAIVVVDGISGSPGSYTVSTLDDAVFTVTALPGFTLVLPLTYTVSGGAAQNVVATANPNEFSIPSTALTGPVILTITATPNVTLPKVISVARVGAANVNGGGILGDTEYDLVLTLDEPLGAAPVAGDFTLSNATIVTGSIDYDDDVTITLTLLPGSTVGELSAATFGVTGVSSADFTWDAESSNQLYSIRRAFTATPTLTITGGTSSASLDGVMQIGFGEAVTGDLSASLNGGTPIDGTPLAQGFSFPYSDLTAEEEYEVIFTGTVTDAWGNDWAPVPQSFTTGDGGVGPGFEFFASASSTTSIRLHWDADGNDGVVVIITQSATPPAVTLPAVPSTSWAGHGPPPARFDDAIVTITSPITWGGLARNTTYYVHAWTFVGGIINTAEYTVVSVTTPNRKDGYTESTSGTFMVSDITPMPVIEGEEAGFNIISNQGGALNVTLIDLSGAAIADIITNTELKENTEIRVPFTVRGLSAGMYSIMISVGDDRVIRTFILNK